MSAGAYLLVKLDDRNKLVPAVETLSGASSLAKWDAVDGHVDLVLKVKEKSPSFIEMVQKLSGFEKLASCSLEADNETGEISPDACASYLFVETAKGRRSEMMAAFERIPQMAFVSPANGQFDLVAVIQGETFDAIDRAVRTDIRTLDGVLRLKQDRVIRLDRL